VAFGFLKAQFQTVKQPRKPQFLRMVSECLHGVCW
jgi:hypothetical protein